MSRRKEEFINLATKSTSRALYEARLKAQRDAWARENDARIAGIEEGEQRGIQKGERRGIQKGRQLERQERDLEMFRLIDAGYSAEQLRDFYRAKNK
jgi:predicted transposase YdaD